MYVKYFLINIFRQICSSASLSLLLEGSSQPLIQSTAVTWTRCSHLLHSKCRKWIITFLPRQPLACVEVMIAFLSKPFLTGHVFSASHSCHFPVDNITGSVWTCHRFMCKISGAFVVPGPYNEIVMHKLYSPGANPLFFPAFLMSFLCKWKDGNEWGNVPLKSCASVM